VEEVNVAPDRPTRRALAQASPALSRMMLGRALRVLREQVGISPERVCEAIQVPASGIDGVERGRSGLRLRDVADLCALYGVTDHHQRATLLSMADLANMPEWWHAYRDVIPGWFEPYLGLEQAASLIRSYETVLIPGLLQTPAYARVLISHGTASGPLIERRVELRMQRQQLLHRPQPTRLWMLIDEAALRRVVGGRALMVGQFRHLLAACDIPDVTIQVLSFRARRHFAETPFTLLRLPERDLPDVIYLEHPTGAVYLDQPRDLPWYLHMLNLLTVEAEPADTTADILSQFLREL
jgi:transcriptional regulator with XRE-family HTH domain